MGSSRWIARATLLPILASGCQRPLVGPPLDVCGADDDDCVSARVLERAVDVLFIIDNSGSMGDEQERLVDNFPALLDALDPDGHSASLRIGFATTDVDGLRATSCRSRLSEFVFDSWDGQSVDRRQTACLDSCGLEAFELLPRGDGEPSLWLEQTPSGSNLPEGIDLDDAIGCVGPQGINGSGFEAPLEAMHRVFVDDADLGFVRDEALLAVVFVTDELDCSMSSAMFGDVISSRGRALWSDPHGERASSAVCWNAGVECVGEPTGFESCFSVDRGLDGTPVTHPEQSVLHPLSRYVNALRDVAARKSNPDRVLVAVVAGVPRGFPQGEPIVYAESENDAFNQEFGIGPGCDRGEENVLSPPGLPPVRLREFAETFSPGRPNLFSICEDDYTPALESIADAIANMDARACVSGCVADRDENVFGLQPACVVTVENGAASEQLRVPACTTQVGGWDFPDEEATLCHRMLTDRTLGTEPSADDVSGACVEQGGTLEVVVEHRDGVSLESGAIVQVTCELSAPQSTGCGDPPSGPRI